MKREIRGEEVEEMLGGQWTGSTLKRQGLKASESIAETRMSSGRRYAL
jgi:hypothetical protein